MCRTITYNLQEDWFKAVMCAQNALHVMEFNNEKTFTATTVIFTVERLCTNLSYQNYLKVLMDDRFPSSDCLIYNWLSTVTTL